MTQIAETEAQVVISVPDVDLAALSEEQADLIGFERVVQGNLVWPICLFLWKRVGLSSKRRSE